MDYFHLKFTMATNNTEPRTLQPTIISYVKDLANLCSLAGLACTLFAIYFSVIGIYYAAMIGMIWAVAFDWADGLVARRLKGRNAHDKTFGMQLDSIIDIVNYGVAPAILLLSYGKFDLLFLPGAFVILVTSALRLSYFNTYGLSGGSKYTGLALDNNNIILVFIFLFESFFAEQIFSVVLYVSCLVLSILNVSQLKTPKLSGRPLNVYILVTYTVGITCLYSWKFV
jgi:CDP-diacylglycerol--serine O-phosphatidyltransferase